MPPVQTSYSNAHAPAYEGMKASVSEVYNTRSYFAEGGNIVAGRAVVAGTDGEKQCTLPATDSVDADFVGVTLYELNRVHDNDIPQNQDRPLTVVTKGPLYLVAQNGASVNDPVYVVINSAGGDTVGGFRSTADSTNTVLLTGAKFISAATAGGLAKVALNRA